MTLINETRPRVLRDVTRRWIERPRVQQAIMALIMINAVILGLETVPAAMQSYGVLLVVVDQVILGIFVVEIVLRIFVHRLAFFRDPWSIFDFIVVGIALIPASGPLAVLRALRILRVLRLLTLVPSMRRVVGALLGSIPGLSSIALVLLLIYYVFAVIATKLFGASFPQWFGSIGESLYSLFQIMTLESWSMGIVRPVMEVHPLAWTFFVPFIVISSFTVLNLFIAIIVDSMQTIHQAEADDVIDEVTRVVYKEGDALANEIANMRAEIQALKSTIERNGAPSTSD